MNIEEDKNVEAKEPETETIIDNQPKSEESTWREEIVKDCPILYCMRHENMQKTCMCWGFECGDGWKWPITNLSYMLEGINILYYKQYGLRIQADQVKEKFGTLRFYFSVVHDPRPYEKVDEDEISTLKQSIYTQASRLVKEAEDECYDLCEICGANIGEHGWEDRCESVGWVKYVCHKCAKTELHGSYILQKTGDEWLGGKKIKTKFERDFERSKKLKEDTTFEEEEAKDEDED